MNLEILTESKIVKLSEMEYTISTKKDYDGDWHDENAYLRQAFVKGIEMALTIAEMK